MAEEKSVLQLLTRTLLEASSVDQRIVVNKVLQLLAATPAGQTLVSWANANPGKFETMIRALAVALHRVPEGQRDVTRELRGVLLSLPFDIRQTVFGNSLGLSPKRGIQDAEDIPATIVEAPKIDFTVAAGPEFEQFQKAARQKPERKVAADIKKTTAEAMARIKRRKEEQE